MGLLGELGKAFLTSIVEEQQAMEEEKEELKGIYNYDSLVEITTMPLTGNTRDYFTDDKLKAIRQIIQEWNNQYENFMENHSMIVRRMDDEQLVEILKEERFQYLFGFHKYKKAEQYLWQEAVRRGYPFKEIMDAWKEECDDDTYESLTDTVENDYENSSMFIRPDDIYYSGNYKDDGNYVFRIFTKRDAAEKVLEERNEDLRNYTDENISEFDNDELINEIFNLKFYGTDNYGEKGEEAYDKCLRELFDNREYLIKECLLEIVNSEEYCENCNYGNLSTGKLQRLLLSDETDLLDKIIIKSLLTARQG